MLSVLGVFFTVVCAVCMAMVLLHAFHRSVGTGLMVLFLPPYLVIYGFTQFEHRLKGLILAGYACGGLLGITLRLLDVSRSMAN